MKLNMKTKLAGFAVVLAFLAPSLTFAQETKTYTVKPGDTLSEIAETYNTTVEKLAKLILVVISPNCCICWILLIKKSLNPLANTSLKSYF